MEQTSGFQPDRDAAERYERFAAPIMLPLASSLVERAQVRAGARVLDVACGTGFVARTAAARVGERGRVVGTDANSAMLAVAASVSRSGEAPIEWREAPAERQPFDEGGFDHVFCQQGLQFVPDLHAALTECARVLRPDGMLAATVWAPLAGSPYMLALSEALRDLLGAEATARFRAAFALDGDRLGATATAAGFTEIDLDEMRQVVRLPALPGYAADHLSALSWGALLLEQRGEGALELAAEAVTERLRGLLAKDGSVEVPFPALVLTALR